jgi:hypothetical protein
VALCGLGRASVAGAQAAKIASATAPAGSGTPATGGAAPSATPLFALPPTQLDFLQYGAAITFEGRARVGDICPVQAEAPCILGSGGGVGIRVGHRSADGWYVGGAYEFSKQAASNLFRLPILQQARAEARYYPQQGNRASPYLHGAAGAAFYGSEWGVQTYGPMVTLGVGLEFEYTRETFIGIMPVYRVARFNRWQDATGQERPAAFAHFVGFELTMEVRSPFSRW